MALTAALRRSAPYAALRRWKQVRRARTWTGDDQRRVAFYGAWLGRGDLCFDVGANLGNRSKVFLHLGARVVAVEPQSECARVLAAAFGREVSFTLVEQALGAEAGTGTIRIPEASTIASMSTEWVDAVQESGRFAGYHWDREQSVAVTTLDALIATHGVPSFVKIDVEGFEGQVVRGLSQPVGVMSLEFTPERIGDTFDAIAHLATLGQVELNYAMGEAMRLELDTWTDPGNLKRLFEASSFNAEDFGDVYVRFPGARPAREARA
jgi:FkbM family methyltransferase